MHNKKGCRLQKRYTVYARPIEERWERMIASPTRKVKIGISSARKGHVSLPTVDDDSLGCFDVLQ